MEFIPAVSLLILISLVFLFIGQKFRLPSVVSFLVIGMLVGPFGLAIIVDQALISTFGEIGIILLLFTIGLELSFEDIARFWKIILVGGFMQVCTTIIVIASITSVLGFPFNEAVFFGFLVSLSSTAIVMRVLQERGAVETLEGTTLLGILIFQDLAIIPMILITPLLIGKTGPSFEHLPLGVAKVILIITVIIVAAIWLIPALLDRVARERNRELFLFTIAGICFTVAYLTNAAGLSLSLGAFIAGLVIGESEYSLDALSDILPFRDLFAGLFFLSIGMLLDMQVILTYFPLVFLVIVTILAVKFLTGWLSVASMGLPPRVAILAGFSLCQIGEFSFVLASSGLQSELISISTYQIFLSGAIVTMAATPFLMGAAQPVTDILFCREPVRTGGREKPGEDPRLKISGHVVIAGFGTAGAAVARAAEIAGMQCHVIDLDPDAARREKEKGVLFTIGDAKKVEILSHAGIGRAAILFVTVRPAKQAAIIVRRARRLAPGLPIVALAGPPDDIPVLSSAGADEVVSSEYEGALRLFARALARFGLTGDEIDPLLSRIRTHTYRGISPRSSEGLPQTKIEKRFEDNRIFSVTVGKGARAGKKTVGEIEAHLPPGVSLVAIRRKGRTLGDVSGDFVLEEGDTLLFSGPPGRAGELAFLVSGE
ncbi:MAG: cation:proton antiporter [Methanolinea sp.]|nr:cation:proton antiporter [Methanolinea sp.]